MKFSRIAGALALIALVSGCSTSAYFKLPEHSKVEIYKRGTQYSEGLVTTSPFAWGATGGITYTLRDDNGTTLQEGRLRPSFRVSSIFWPPFSLIYWPMKFGQTCYDLTGTKPLTCTEQDLIDLRRGQRLPR